MTSNSPFVCWANTVRSAPNRCALALEDVLVLVDARHHVGDDVLVLPEQLAEIGELLGDARSAALPGRSHTSATSARIADRVASPTSRRFAGMSLRGQRVLERRQAAPFEQRVVAVDLGQETFLRRNGKDLHRGKPQERRGGLDLTADVGGDGGLRLELVPQAVDFVQHHEPRGPFSQDRPPRDRAARRPGRSS